MTEPTDLQLAKEWEARCASYQAEVLELEQRAQAAEAQRDRLAEALKMAAGRFHDLGDIIRKDGKYDNPGFCHASANRCIDVLSRLDETREKK